MSDLRAIAPQAIVALWGILLLVLDLFLPKKRVLAYLSLLGLIAAGVVCLALWGLGAGEGFGGAIALDEFSIFTDLILLLAASLSVLVAERYNPDLGMDYGEYYPLLLFATAGAMLMAAASDLLVIFLGLEILSISLYILAGFRRGESRSQEAALKYFILGAFASAFTLYGIALLFGATGATNLRVMAASLGGGSNNPLLLFSLGFLVVGFGFKVALVPFHAWVPDVYEGAPTPTVGYMSVAAKAAGFAVLFRLFPSAFFSLENEWSVLLIALSILTMTVGNLIALAQKNIKRLLAYSSIAHAGYVLLGVIAASDWGMQSALYYLLAYAFMNIGAFAVVAAMRKGEHECLELDDYAGLGYRKPLLAAALTLFLLSLASIPPMGGFLAKFYLFSAAVEKGYAWLVIIGVLNSVIAAYYYLRVIVFMYMREPEREVRVIKVAPALAVAMVIALFGTMWMGVFPSPILQLLSGVVMP